MSANDAALAKLLESVWPTVVDFGRTADCRRVAHFLSIRGVLPPAPSPAPETPHEP